MTARADDLTSLLSQLEHKTSSKRRSAAKKLRKMQVAQAGSALMDALEREIRDPRTWETQYHMIMALAECGIIDSLPLLHRIAAMDLEHTMVLLASGDAITRLEYLANTPYCSLDKWLRRGAKELLEGSFRALAMLRLAPDEELTDRIINYASEPGKEEVRFWVAAACPGWNGDKVTVFLRQCLNDISEHTRRAAAAALEKKYLKWRPL